MKTITITLPSDFWMWEPENHIINFDDILGWLVRRVDGNASMSITEEDAKYALESWEMARNEGWIVAQPPTKDLQDIIAMTDPDSWIEEANCSTAK